MNPLFVSSLAKPFNAFVAVKRVSGTDYLSQTRLLKQFDRFLQSRDYLHSIIVTTIFNDYLATLSHLSKRARDNHLCVIRQVCHFIAQTDQRCYIPIAVETSSSFQLRRPYLFSLEEVRIIIDSAKILAPHNSLLPHTYATLFALLYCTGIRPIEAQRITLEDYQPSAGRLFVKCGKYGKSRWIPLSASINKALKIYLQQRQLTSKMTSNDCLFVNLKGSPLNTSDMSRYFKKTLRLANISAAREYQLSTYCLRHTFAVHRLTAWYQQGIDVNAKLPHLATYMGHVDIQSTQAYLHATPVLMSEVSQRFHRFVFNA